MREILASLVLVAVLVETRSRRGAADSVAVASTAPVATAYHTDVAVMSMGSFVRRFGNSTSCQSDDDCGEHGDCDSNGKCVCDLGYFGNHCSKTAKDEFPSVWKTHRIVLGTVFGFLAAVMLLHLMFTVCLGTDKPHLPAFMLAAAMFAALFRCLYVAIDPMSYEHIINKVLNSIILLLPEAILMMAFTVMLVWWNRMMWLLILAAYSHAPRWLEPSVKVLSIVGLVLSLLVVGSVVLACGILLGTLGAKEIGIVAAFFIGFLAFHTFIHALLAGMSGVLFFRYWWQFSQGVSISTDMKRALSRAMHTISTSLFGTMIMAFCVISLVVGGFVYPYNEDATNFIAVLTTWFGFEAVFEVLILIFAGYWSCFCTCGTATRTQSAGAYQYLGEDIQAVDKPPKRLCDGLSKLISKGTGGKSSRIINKVSGNSEPTDAFIWDSRAGG